jgi:hypothetical protein
MRKAAARLANVFVTSVGSIVFGTASVQRKLNALIERTSMRASIDVSESGDCIRIGDACPVARHAWR